MEIYSLSTFYNVDGEELINSLTAKLKTAGDKEKWLHTSSVCVFSFFAPYLSGEWTDCTTSYYDCHLTFDSHS